MEIWGFHSEGGQFSNDVFTDRAKAEQWIRQYQLSGLLTLYPLNSGVYDWAIEQGYFTVRTVEQAKPSFIQRFTSASQEHYHYEKGEQISD